MDGLTVGVVASSRKEHERRLPLHPRHLHEIDPKLRGRILLEEGYGEPFQVSDAELSGLVGGLLPRERLFEEADAVILPKPVAEDVAAMREEARVTAIEARKKSLSDPMPVPDREEERVYA